MSNPILKKHLSVAMVIYILAYSCKSNILIECSICCTYVGPTIKFERFYSAAEQSKESTQFFACAVYRSRKQCNFYHPTKNQISTDKRQQYYKHYTEYQESLLASVINGALDIVLRMDSAERCICETCGVLLINERMMDDHSGHTLRHGLCEKQLLTPTSLLRPHDDNKGQAVSLINIWLII